SEASAFGGPVKSALFTDDCGGSFLFVSFLVFGANSLAGGVVFGVVGACRSVSITSGSLLDVVDSAGLAGFVVWMCICSGAIGGRFWAFSGCTCGKADRDGKRFDGSTSSRDSSPITGVGGTASTSLTSLVRVFAWSLKQGANSRLKYNDNPTSIRMESMDDGDDVNYKLSLELRYIAKKVVKVYVNGSKRGVWQTPQGFGSVGSIRLIQYMNMAYLRFKVDTAYPLYGYGVSISAVSVSSPRSHVWVKKGNSAHVTTGSGSVGSIRSIQVPRITANTDGTSTLTISTEEKAQKKNDVKAKSMMLMAFLDEHLLTFSQYKDAKTLFEAIQARYGGNDATKKTQKTLLKQMMRTSMLLNTHVVVWRNKPDLETMSFDDLYNNFKIVEQEVKRTVVSSSSLGSPNMAFLSSPSSTNEVDTASIQVSTASTPVSIVSSPDNTVTLVMQLTDKKTTINGSDTAGYDKTKVECFNRHKMGHFARECRSPRSQESRPRNQDNSRKTVIVEDTSFKAMVAIDEAGFDWSYMADNEVPTNMALMAFSDSKGDPQAALRDTRIFDKGCSRHMTGNKSFLSDYQEHDGGFIAFAGSFKEGKITSKGKIRTGKLDFKDVYFVKELKFNLFSVLQMCDKKNSVLFTETECLNLSPDFKLSDKNQVLLKHKRLGHINFKTMNRLVKGNLVRGLPLKIFENDHTCVACQKGKQYKASCKSKLVNSVSQPLQILHMDLVGPTFIKSIMEKTYSLVVTDDYSRFSWVFFLAKKDETSGILKDFITGIENQLNHNVKIIRCDNKTEFKNYEMNQFCRIKGIKREFNSLLPIPFWAEAVSTASYVQNKVLVTKPYNKTPYELLIGRAPIISFMRPFGCLITILNTLDHVGKFDGKADEGFLVGYSINSKAFRVYNSRTKKVEENLHVNFLENKLNVAGSGPEWLFNIDSLTNSMNYQPVSTGNRTNRTAGSKIHYDARQEGKEKVSDQEYILLPMLNTSLDVPSSNEEVVSSPKDDAGKKSSVEPTCVEGGKIDDLGCLDQQMKSTDDSENTNSTNSFNTASPTVNAASDKDGTFQRTYSEWNFSSPITINVVSSSFSHSAALDDFSKMPNLENTGISDDAYDDRDEGAEANYNNLETVIPVSPIPSTRIHKNHPKEHIIGEVNSVVQTRKMAKQIKTGLITFINKQRRTNHKDFQNCLFTCFLSQMEPKKQGLKQSSYSWLMHSLWTSLCTKWMSISAFLYVTIKEEVYVSQPRCFVDPEFPDRVYKVEKALDGLHQAPKAWYETLLNYLLENGFKRGTIHKTLFIKKIKDDILLVQVYVDDIIFCSTKRSLSTEFEQLMHNRFQMSSMGEITFFLRLQVEQRKDGIFLVRTNIYLKGHPTLGLWYPKDSPLKLIAYSKSDYAGASLDRKSTTREYIAASSCYGQVLWLQNQLLDYGYNFMQKKNHVDNKSAICMVKNPVYYSKTKHIEIRHHFIKDSYEKRFIEMVKIHTDSSVADLLTKAFDVTSSKTVNFVKQIHAIVDGKAVVISESLMRSDLLFDDEDGITCLTNDEIFENLALMGYEPLSTKLTFQKDEVVNQEEGDRVKRVITTDASLEAAQDSDNIIKTQTTAMPNVYIPLGIDTGSSLRSQKTMGGTSAQTRSERVLEQPNELPLIEGHTSGSREGRLEKNIELADTKKSRAVIHSSDEEGLSVHIEYSPKQGRIIEEIDKDENINLKSSAKDKGKGIMQETELPKKLKKKEMIQLSLDEELAQKLYAEELEKEEARQEQERYNLEKALELQRRLDQRKENVPKGDQAKEIDWNDPQVLRYHALQNRPFSKAEVRKNMIMYLKNQEGYKQSYFKGMKYEDIRPLFENQQTKETKEEAKAQGDSDQEVEELKLYMRIIPEEEIAIEAIPLAIKPSVIIKYKIVKEGKISTYHITRVDGSTRRYTSMINLLKNIDREDLETLWKLVKDKYGNIRPEEGYEKVLWGDLKVLFEPDIKSDVWRQLQRHDVTVWKLFSSCGMHFVRFKNLHIFLLVDKVYPLTPVTIKIMLERKLQADQWNEMCYQLLKLMMKQLRKQ
nr:hypothetical protein [Tanacetum cinerariifolium]